MARLDTELKVATACGPGVGRFLAEALVDALQSDLHLIAVEGSAGQSGDDLHSVDFVFARDDSDRLEIIRVGVDQDGQVVSTELIRSAGREGQRTAAVEEELLAAIRSGESVSALHWIDRPGNRPESMPEAMVDGRPDSMVESTPERGAGDELSPRRVLAITVRSDRRFQIPLGG